MLKKKNKPFLYIISILFFHNRESAQVAFVKSGILNWWNADSIPKEYEITKILPQHKFRKNDKFLLTKGFEKYFRIKGREIRT